ncbi:MAG TPA: aminotransferase class III-fold pyridoxal phosphate-dependent enzyme [Roseiflexaceae bacterium]|nr:aminotransferase class III-fold pyridoxal phosphate-dependent enzyme [Roseiflexaceae bacterium]
MTGVPESVTQAQTLVELLRWRALHQADALAFIFLADGETQEQRLTYAELDGRARAIAARLHGLCEGGERALLLYPSGLDYMAAFFGCLYAGVIAVPVYPPHPSKAERSLPRIQGIVEDARPQVLLTTAALLPVIERVFAPLVADGRSACLATDTLDPRGADAWRDPLTGGDTLAFLQYTSGSTAAPRGVMVSHANLLANHRMFHAALQHPAGASYVSWLPLFHDMGLIGSALQAVYLGAPCVLLSPMAFLQRPLRWLEAIARYRAATSGAPNFAYDLCVRQSTPEQRAALDLSCWKVAFNGAEPVRAETLERFTQAFAPAGFRRAAFFPCYGLAEATLFVSGPLDTAPPLITAFQSAALDHRRVVPADPALPGARRLVGCGQSWLDQRIVIADPETGRRCPPDQIGEIWVAGPHIPRGYWGMPARSEQTFGARLAGSGEGPFLRTGDLGFLWEGQLFVGGRIKDVIIIRGRNHYPQDIEATVERCHPALRAGAGAACAVDVDGEERLVLVQEVERSAIRRLDVEAVAAAVRRAVADAHELDVHAVVLLKTGTIPKTSSGKIQRHACRAGFLAGSLAAVGEWRRPTAAPAPVAAAPPSVDAAGVADVRAWLADAIAQRCNLAPDQLDPRQPLASYGLHSADLVGLSGQLADWLGRPLAPTLLYDYPTIEALAQHLGGLQAPAATPAGTGRMAEAEPVALIGMGCRFPGARSPEALWALLRDGVDAVGVVPADRWDADAFYSGADPRPGMINTRWGGFLEEVDRFDPAFFNLSPREAEQIDPQQRLLLEVGWEALEHAGVAPDSLAGRPVGVFVGISNSDYSRLRAAGQADAYSGTGSALSVAAGRLAYLLDLRGPALALDTACSSSLVAVHLACESLRRGECEMALAGGVNLILTPDVSVTLAQAQMLSPDGRCRTFDAGANGYVRGEGCGVVVLKPLAAALRDGDPVLALIRGSAVNQDGRSNGITAPNGLAQQAVVRQALERAGVLPAELGYVEAHGSGTALGDPIEVGALRALLVPGRPADAPCLLGSLKSNIGHLEAAAGVAGLIKAVLVLQHAEIPPQLHLRALNPHLGIEGTPLAIATARQPWPGAGRRLAGVSSFGFSGTNAHVVLEAAPEPPARVEQGEHSPQLLALSAKGAPALAALAARYARLLAERPDTPLADLCHSAAVGRAHFPQRLALVAESTEQARALLIAFAAGERPDGLLHARANRQQPRVAFLFTGQGAQYSGMGRDLYADEPVFRAALDRCADILLPLIGEDIRQIIFEEPEKESTKDTKDTNGLGQEKSVAQSQAPSADDAELKIQHSTLKTPAGEELKTQNSKLKTTLAQPALFALEYALAELWMSWGVRPDVLLGHSLGEYVAACVAGVFSLEDGLRLVAERARMMQSLPANGAMAAVLAGEARVAGVIGAYGPALALAAANGPAHCTISGEAAAVQAVRAALESEGIETRPLRVSHAFHSPLIEPILPAFARAAAAVAYAPPRIPIISNLTGELAGDAIAGPDYWVRQARLSVRFADGVATLGRRGIDVLIEIGPEPVLSALGRQTLTDPAALWLPSLRRREADRQTVLRSLGALYVRGAAIDWAAFGRPHPRRRVDLPTYPFQRQRHWVDGFVPTPEGEAMVQPAVRTNGAQPAAPPRDQIAAALREIVAAALQVAPADLDPQANFIDMGADSIVLLEAIRRIEQLFGQRLAIRQLFEELATLDALSAYLAQHLPPGWHLPASAQSPSAPLAAPAPIAALPAAAVPVSVAAPTAVPVQAPAPGGIAAAPAGPPPAAVEALLREQVQAMSRLLSEQLAFLSGAAPVLVSAPATPAPTAAPTPAVPAPAPAQPRADSTYVFEQDADKQAKTKTLTPEQQRYLDAFVSRYNRRTGRSKQFTADHRPVWADFRSTIGFRQETKELCYTLVAERASGSRMWDLDGNEYIDVAMGFGVHLFGHNPAFIREALHEQLQQSIAIGPQPALVGEVSRLISELTGMERVTYCNSGTEAVMTAIRLARAASGRTRIVIFSDAYHGHSDHTLAVAKQINGVRTTVPWVPGVPESVVGEVLVLPYGDPASLEVVRSHLHELAAVLVEPVQSRRPNLQPVEFLRELRLITAAADVALIFDEVITGFRIHPGGAQAHFGIRADLATYGKIVGGGMPIGVVAGAARYLDRIDGGPWAYGDDSFPSVATSFAAGTFCKHPLAMAAARAVLLRLRSQGQALLDGVSRRTERMATALEDFFQHERLPIRIARFGSVFRFTLGNNYGYLFQPLEMDLLFYQLINRGIYLWEGRTCFLSTEHSDADVDQLVEAVQAGVTELREGGFFGGPRSGGGSPGPRSAANGNGQSSERAAEGVRQIVHTFPLTRPQQQLWALAQMGDDGMISSKLAGGLRMRGPLDPAALHRALQTIVDRHETLRSTLGRAGDLQHVWSSMRLDLPLVDLSALDPAEREPRVGAWFEEESRRAFDFVAGPLFRATLIRLAPEEHILAWATHHIVVDGWSVTVILRELAALYDEQCGGRPARLRPPMQFREYIVWQQRQMESSAMAASADYWRALVTGAPPALNLPTDRPRPQIKTYTGSRLTRRFDAAFGRALKQTARDNGATVFMLLLAAHNALIHQITSQEDILVGVPTGGRSLDQGDQIVGYCTNVMPIRSRLAAGQTFHSYLRSLRAALLEAYEHQDFPFAELLAQLNMRRDPGASPLVSVIFNLEPRVPLQSAFALEVDLITPCISYTAYELDLNITEIGDEFILDYDHNSDLFDQATVAGLLDNFTALLREVARDPARPVAGIYRALRDQAEKEAQQAARQQFKRLREERLRRSSGPTLS